MRVTIIVAFAAVTWAAPLADIAGMPLNQPLTNEGTLRADSTTNTSGDQNLLSRIFSALIGALISFTNNPLPDLNIFDNIASDIVNSGNPNIRSMQTGSLPRNTGSASDNASSSSQLIQFTQDKVDQVDANSHPPTVRTSRAFPEILVERSSMVLETPGGPVSLSSEKLTIGNQEIIETLIVANDVYKTKDKMANGIKNGGQAEMDNVRAEVGLKPLMQLTRDVIQTQTSDGQVARALDCQSKSVDCYDQAKSDAKLLEKCSGKLANCLRDALSQA
ncbi:hypothetical protein HDE_05376 [Halotydeus destructor]|nr:hypothetical protein HDE_05376 [Halotydeus destructor]